MCADPFTPHQDCSWGRTHSQPPSHPGEELKVAISLILLSVFLRRGNQWCCCVYFTAVQSLAQIPSAPSSCPQISHLPVQLISCTPEQGNDSPDGFICKRETPGYLQPFLQASHIQMLCLVPRKKFLRQCYPPPPFQNSFQSIAKRLVTLFTLSQQNNTPLPLNFVFCVV